MKLSELNRSFIERSSKSIVESFAPIKASKSVSAPIIAIEKWSLDDEGFLSKKYVFESAQDRNVFVVSLLNYELESGHHAQMRVEMKQVLLRLKTHDVDKVTELDKEYSRYADIIRRDIAYNLQHG